MSCVALGYKPDVCVFFFRSFLFSLFQTRYVYFYFVFFASDTFMNPVCATVCMCVCVRAHALTHSTAAAAAAAAPQPNIHRFTCLVWTLSMKAIPPKPKGHVDHMALHSQPGCTTQCYIQWRRLAQLLISALSVKFHFNL